jgi:hypothetical protein
MPSTITIDILNDKALKLLLDLEWMQLIKLHPQPVNTDKTVSTFAKKFKGAMSKQSTIEIEQQFKALRQSWE